MKKVVIVIPVYKAELNENEIISLKQVCKVLGSYDICFVGPDNIKMDLFAENTDEIQWEKFATDYFRSVEAYNRLMLQEEFYNRFAEYEYMLVYQLDAFVFEDKLEYFCSLQYDYIGAPWLCGEVINLYGKDVCCHVGNGGLSLRRIEGIRKVLNKLPPVAEQNEDVFFASAGFLCEEFCVAPLRIALEFSFERQVRECFAQNNYELPFGCHAWEKYDLDFWKPYIEQCGYVLHQAGILNQHDREQAFVYKLKERESYICKYGLRKYLEVLLNEQARRLVVWGAGFWGNRMCKILLQNGFEINYIIDNNRLLKGERVETIEIVGLEELPRKADWYYIVAVDKQRDEIAKQLEINGFAYKNNYIYFDDIIRKNEFDKF